MDWSTVLTYTAGAGVVNKLGVDRAEPLQDVMDCMLRSCIKCEPRGSLERNLKITVIYDFLWEEGDHSFDETPFV